MRISSGVQTRRDRNSVGGEIVRERLSGFLEEMAPKLVLDAATGFWEVEKRS